MAKPLKTNKGFRLQFHFHNIHYRHGLIKNEHAARVLQARINTLLEEIKCGLVNVPQHISICDFIFNSVLKQPETSHTQHSIINISDLIDEYQKYCVPPIKSKSTCQTEKYHLARLQDFLFSSQCNPELTQIKIGLFNDYKKFRYSHSIKTDTVKKELATFQAMFKFAVEHGWIAHNPVREVKRDKSQVMAGRFRTISEIQRIVAEGKHTKQETSEIKRFAYLTQAEIKELFEIARDHWMLSVLKVFAYTGMRRGELCKLTWLDVDFERNILQVSSQKQSQKRDVKRNIEMHKEVVSVLRSQRMKTGNSRFVFINALGNQIKEDTLNEVFVRLTHGTKFEGIGFHVFRHSLASNLAASGVDQRVIDSILGHQTEEMRKRYQHLFPGKQSEALKNLAF